MPDSAFEAIGGRDTAEAARKRIRKAKRAQRALEQEAIAQQELEAAAAVQEQEQQQPPTGAADDEYGYGGEEDGGFEIGGGGADDEYDGPTMEWAGGSMANGSGAKRSAEGAGVADAPAAKVAKRAVAGDMALQRESSGTDLLDAHGAETSVGAAPAAKPKGKIKLNLS